MNSRKSFLKVFFTFMAIITPWVLAIILFKDYYKEKPIEKEQAHVEIINYEKQDTIPKVDHSKFEILQQEFKSPQDVTAACLSCHNLTDHDLMKTSHWNWARKTEIGKGDTVLFGKRNAINNFCIGLESNEARCTSCHVGYGWKNKAFDFKDHKNIDCIICHDQTGTYKKFPTKAGYPVKEKTIFGKKAFLPPDYNLIAQNVGSPKRENCGACHYFGGGGNNVKHGDLSKELTNTNTDVDVHMAKDGPDMSCVACHKTEHHKISGQLYTVSSENKERVTCTQCHPEAPHKNKQLNLHANKVARQACHIPEYAKDNPTKMSWDWSQAGKHNPDGSIIVKKDSLGNMTYHTLKGAFVWKKHVKPEYVWFNGKAKHYMLGDKIDTSKAVVLNTLLGSYEDPEAKITPVKVHRAKQIYDTENQTIINPHLFGKDSTAYWKNFDWNKAAATGMAAVNIPYSGKFGFVNTETYWPVNHMVSKSKEALSCNECHSRDGRLNQLTGFYLSGRDSNKLIDWIGILMVIGSLAGVAIHASLRIINSPNNKKNKK